MIDITPLLQPVSADNPCGPDISYDPLFLKLEGLLAGKPETQFSASEEPAWSAIRDTCVELLVRSKNLRVAVTLCVALVKLDGAAGLRDGLSLLTELLVRYWPDLYPKLDPEEHNDPLERINILSSLATPIGTFGDPVRFLERVRQIPLARSKRMETFSFADIAGDKRLMPGGQERAPASQGEIAAAFKDTGPIALAATDLALTESIALATKLDNFLTTTVGTKRSSDMSALSNLLREIKKALGPHVPKPAEDPGRAPAELAGASPLESGVQGGGDSIQSRRDVIRALDHICDYYTRVEPSSPLPFLLKRAMRLAEMDFLQIVAELAPEARGNLETVVGFKSQAPDAGESEG